jgi:Polymer-forming cytoskeletal
MLPQTRLVLPLLLALVSLAAHPTAALAESAHERTQFGHDITVGAGEVTGEVTCFGCSVRVRGHVTSDVTTFGGSVILEDSGQVAGDVAAFGGNVRLDGPVTVDGDLSVFGGRIHRDSAATVGGDVTNFGGGFWMLLIFGLPLVMLGAFIALIIWLVRTVSKPRIPATA